MSFDTFKKHVNFLIYDLHQQNAISILINRYGLNKVDYYFNQINISCDNSDLLYFRNYDNKPPLDFEIKDVMYHCEYE